MPKEWDDNRFPLAYLLTFRTYGTWHHGDQRGAVDRNHFNGFGSPAMPFTAKLAEAEAARQKGPTVVLDDSQRHSVDEAIKEVCNYREYTLHALNVRTNHVHAVVAAELEPEKIVEAFKSYATRRLRHDGLTETVSKVWSRHASTKYLWEDHKVISAIDYVLYSQGGEFGGLDDVGEI
jgi:REP element-mobilizing transposase RayT